MQFVSHNLNDFIYIRFKEGGLLAWKEAVDAQRDALFGLAIGHELPLSWYENKVRSDGYVRFQLHEFMALFGPRLYPGANLPFETAIRFEFPRP